MYYLIKIKKIKNFRVIWYTSLFFSTACGVLWSSYFSTIGGVFVSIGVFALCLFIKFTQLEKQFKRKKQYRRA